VQNHLLGGVVGVLAVLIGIAWGLGALRRRAARVLEPRQYAEMGGIVYTVFQLFFAAALIGIGLVIMVLMATGR